MPLGSLEFFNRKEGTTEKADDDFCQITSDHLESKTTPKVSLSHRESTPRSEGLILYSYPDPDNVRIAQEHFAHFWEPTGSTVTAVDIVATGLIVGGVQAGREVEKAVQWMRGISYRQTPFTGTS